MLRITIEEEVKTPEDLVDLLNFIATKVKDGYTSGHYPHWYVTEVEEEVIEA